jgi:hypothetical protein
MKATYFYELRRMFCGRRGWGIVALFLFLEGLCFAVFNLALGAGTVLRTLGSLAVLELPVLLWLVGAHWTRERGEREERFFASLPLPTWQRTLAKYASALTVYLLSHLPLFLFTYLLPLYGGESLSTTLTAVLGYLMMEASVLSMLSLVASLCEKKRVCAIVGGAVCVLLYAITYLPTLIPGAPWLSLVLLLSSLAGVAALVAWLCGRWIVAPVAFVLSAGAGVVLFVLDRARFAYLFPRLLTAVHPFLRFTEFTAGRMDIGGILLFLSMAVLFQLLTVAYAEQRRGA